MKRRLEGKKLGVITKRERGKSTGTVLIGEKGWLEKPTKEPGTKKNKWEEIEGIGTVCLCEDAQVPKREPGRYRYSPRLKAWGKTGGMPHKSTKKTGKKKNSEMKKSRGKKGQQGGKRSKNCLRWGEKEATWVKINPEKIVKGGEMWCKPGKRKKKVKKKVTIEGGEKKKGVGSLEGFFRRNAIQGGERFEKTH